MNKLMQKASSRYAAAGAGLATVLVPTIASAAPQDYSPLATSVTAEIGAVLPVVLPIVGLITAVGIGIRMFRRFAK